MFLCLKKIYGSPTRVTRLKVAANMADATSKKYSVSSLKSKFYISKFSKRHFISIELFYFIAFRGEFVGFFPKDTPASFLVSFAHNW